MPQVFLSYSGRDHFFAELAVMKLADWGITVWRDRGQLRAGADWREGIERGIADSVAVLVALSSNSAESSYVTYEWAYGLGKGKPVIPLRLTECTIHPKLATIQYLDFTISRALPWESLVERIREVEIDSDSLSRDPLVAEAGGTDETTNTVNAILAYLNQRGYQMVSFDRIRRRIDSSLTDEQLDALISRHPTVFRPATLKEGKRGLAKLVP